MMAKPSVAAFRVSKFLDNNPEETDDLLAVEEPLEIRLAYGSRTNRKEKSISVTMRTPGQDFELALGFLFTEGIIYNKADVRIIRYCEKNTENLSKENIVLVELAESVEPELKKLERNFYTSSSCGICGKASIEAVRTIHPEMKGKSEKGFTIGPKEISSLPLKLREQQLVFGYTGGLHAAALFNSEGELLLLREDVGRHNALDKLIGATFEMNNLPLDQHILFLSGRSSFELIQKAVMAGIKFVASVGAPSSLALSLAKEFNITLLGFVRDKRFNIYNGFERINN